jgi:hypothetical protein
MINDNWITWQQVKDEKGHLCKAKVMLFFPRNVHVFSVWFSCLSVLIRCSTSLPHVFTNGGGLFSLKRTKKEDCKGGEWSFRNKFQRKKTKRNQNFSHSKKKCISPNLFNYSIRILWPHLIFKSTINEFTTS